MDQKTEIHSYIKSRIRLNIDSKQIFNELCGFCLFVLRFYGPGNPMGVMLSAVSLPNHTFTGQA